MENMAGVIGNVAKLTSLNTEGATALLVKMMSFLLFNEERDQIELSGTFQRLWRKGLPATQVGMRLRLATSLGSHLIAEDTFEPFCLEAEILGLQPDELLKQIVSEYLQKK